MKKSRLKTVLSVLFAIVLTFAISLYAQEQTTSPQPVSNSTHTPQASTSNDTTNATSPTPVLSTLTPTSTATTTERERIEDKSQFGNIAPEDATHIKVTDGCEHDYSGACLNARRQPNASSPVVTQLRNGQVLKVDGTVDGQDRSWYRVTFSGEWLRYPNRLPDTWYVAGEYVQPLDVKGKGTAEPGNASSSKRIVVDLSEQELTAYASGSVFMREAVSTGRALFPTPRGTFPVYKMMPSRYMQGPIPNIADQHYDLPGVPWNLYFTYQGAVIHGAYWHNQFGQPWSHGCVNLPPEQAEKLYQWAELGTEVVVKD
jgi:hypothetical protein